MIFHRGTKGAFQRWAEDVDDESYTFENLLPFFKKSVDWTPPPAHETNFTIRYNETAFAPKGGPLHVSYPTYIAPFSTWLDASFKEIGIPLAEDFNSGVLNGVKFVEATINPVTHLRSSSQSSFLDAAKNRTNLVVYANTTAEKILFTKKTAVGVKVNGSNIYASREVILAAGAFQSPQLLMLSGIGPSGVLKKHDIPAVANLSGVGQNMWDHIFFGPSYEVNLQTYASPAASAEALTVFETSASGPLANNNAD